MIVSNSTQLVAVSFHTNNFNDLLAYMSIDGYNLERIDPHEFMSGPVDKTKSYINLVVFDMSLRQDVSNYMNENNADRFTFIHDTSIVHGSTIGNGIFMYPFVLVYPGAVVENDCIVFSHSCVAHSCLVKRGNVIGESACIAGSTTIGEFGKSGVNVTIYDKVIVANNVEFGARCIVRKDVTECGVYGLGKNNNLLKM